MMTEMTTRAGAELQAALIVLGDKIDPEKPESFDVTLVVADALTALAPALAPFERARAMLQRQHGFEKLKPGDSLPPAYIDAITEAGERKITVRLPEPITRDQLRAVLKPGMHPADLARLALMLEARGTAPAKSG